MAETIASKLDKSRQSLLDLSTRNRLLSLPKRATGKILNIYDELTAEVYRRLVIDNKSMTFLPGRAAQGEALESGADDEAGVSLPQPDEEVDASGVAGRHKDSKLQTKLTSDKLQHRLLEMYYDSRTFIEEQGVNILYLGLGQLTWIDEKAPDKERRAPLILLPVALERKSAAERFHLLWLEEDAAENLSLAAKLKADFGLILPEFNAGDDFDPSVYINDVASAVSSLEKWSVDANAVVLGFFSFAKFLMYRDLDPETWPNDKRLDQQSLILATMQNGFPEKGQIFPESTHIDKLVSVEEQRHVVDADSSQSLAIEAVRRGENLVIQGPPGTGKSQTITNIIAAAVADGKKVLFVSEKMAALEVVYRRLSAIGLGPACLELHSNRTNKRKVLEELKETKELGCPKLERRDEVIQQLSKTRDELNYHASLMHARLKPIGITPYNVIGHLVKLQDVKLTGLPKLIERPESWSTEEFRARKASVAEYIIKGLKIGNPTRHPWRGVGRISLLKLEADDLLEKIPMLQKMLGEIITASKNLAATLAQPAADRIKDVNAQIEISQLIAEAPEIDRVAIASAVWSSGLSELKTLIEIGARFNSSYQNLQSNFIESAWLEDIAMVRRHIAAHGDSLLRIFSIDYRKSMQIIKSHLKESLPKPLKDKLRLIDALIESQQLQKSLREQHEFGISAFGALWRGENSDWGKLNQVLLWMHGKDGSGLSSSFRTLYASLPEPAGCVSIGIDLNEKLKPFKQLLTEVIASYSLDMKEAFDVATEDEVSLSGLQIHLSQWLELSESIFDWTQYQTARKQLKDLGLNELVQQSEAEKIPLDQLVRYFERAYYESLIRIINHNAPQFASFDGEQHNRKVENFRILDRDRIQVARVETALRHYEQVPRAGSGIGPMGTLNAEIARKRGHMPLRKLFKLTGSAIQAIKPVFMMSPLSVAQFLEPGAVEFDMLVIDEASQIEPVDALGAIARCKQLVVVGDDRQLPPTRFFSRMTTEVDADESNDESFVAGASDVESVLSLCIARGMPQMMLRWHYRSRHQSLIAVSNQQFYKSELFIVPSPYTAASEMGLKFNYIANGTFDSGGARINREEAKAIAKRIIIHATTNQNQSLGVAAFSLQQKIAIQDELELLRRQHPEAEPYFTAHANEPFFIKNLENIQGDERDVIYISVAYARPTSGGPLSMGFGPISRDGGERRLNVLISRAKLRCEVFSSIKADDIDLERGKGKGVAALKVFLSYAETGRISIASKTDREHDSIFEEEVKSAIEEEGFAVHPQVGLAGFFIDLAILDAERTGRYLLGIECDGAAYHSSRSARDRDRLRQSVLEDHGWILHRIWSADWFQSPKRELEKIKQAIQSAKYELSQREEESTENQSKKIQINFVDRDEETVITLDIAEQEYEAYREARFPVPKNQELHEVPIARLALILKKVVEIEGPIHFEEAITRIRSLWGLQRSGNRIKDIMEQARSVAVADKILVSGENFLDLPNRATRIRSRHSVSSANLRKPEFLPPSEVQSAIQKLLMDNLGGSEEEIPAAVGKLLGFNVVSAQLKEIILNHLLVLKNSGKVKLSAEGFYRNQELS